MNTSQVDAERGGGALPVIHLSQLLRAPVVARSGDVVGRVEDVIVRLRGADEYPLVTGIVAGSSWTRSTPTSVIPRCSSSGGPTVSSMTTRKKVH